MVNQWLMRVNADKWCIAMSINGSVPLIIQYKWSFLNRFTNGFRVPLIWDIAINFGLFMEDIYTYGVISKFLYPDSDESAFTAYLQDSAL